MLLGEEQLKEYGRRLGSELEPGAVVALVGELGAGKTTLAKAVASGLCIKEHVTSPTFTIINEYSSGRLPLYHIDLYRLDNSDLAELGIDEYIDGCGVTVIEWADRIEELIPEDALWIELSYTDDPDVRRCELRQGPGR
jgi:tRNA threonylcarbamoyladenosine biosynthesis protein TsaE